MIVDKLHPRLDTSFPVPEANWPELDASEGLRRYLKEVHDVMDVMLDQNIPSPQVVAWRTAAIDKVLIKLFEGEYTLIALGGYGRSELCYHSDIDLLFLHDASKASSLKKDIERVLYPLWDAGLDVGFAVRTTREALSLMREDITILTAMMDGRYLAGNRERFASFMEDLWKAFQKDSFRKDFVLKKEKEQQDRAQRFGTTIYLLEPNAKDGKGGLRDYHHIHWLTQAFTGSGDLNGLIEKGWLMDDETQALESAVQFLWSVRNLLHARTGRRTDQILFDHQEALAKSLGFHDSEKILAAEDFMRTYYHHAADCYRISQKLTRKLVDLSTRKKSFRKKTAKVIDDTFEVREDQLYIRDENEISRNPYILLNIFRVQQETGCELSRSLKESIRKSLHFIDHVFQNNPDMGVLFRHMFSQPENLLDVLLSMHETHVLERFLPEFGNLMYRVQHDIYHLYTVDIHSILAVGEFGKLISGEYDDKYPTASKAAQAIANKALLAFGILYHDIGKGEGKGHVEKGAPLIRHASKRLGFSTEDQDMLEFLELSHLIMPHLAFRRDLDDPNLILSFAESMGNEEQLTYLYLLTFCDIKAVSPEALSNWKESLLEYLFVKTRTLFQKGDFAKERVAEVKAKLLEEVKILSRGEFSDGDINEFFQIMPARYFFTAQAVTILDHMSMRREFAENPIVHQHKNLEKEGLSEWSLYTLASSLLFPTICGVLAANNVSIYDAQINTCTDGTVLLILKITTAQGAMITSDEKWHQIDSDLRMLIQGRRPLHQFIAGKFKPSLLQKKSVRRLPTKVHIDNDLSPFYTIVDIYAHDRIGLLYHITSALAELGLYVDVSKIATKVDQVTDTFYVRDIFRHKITSKQKLDHIRQTLTNVIDSYESRQQEAIEAKA